MKGNFDEIISASIEWTKTVLFRPFRLKKWLMLFIIALFAFQMSGGCNSNINLPRSDAKKTVESKEAKTGAEAVTETKPASIKNTYNKSVEERGKVITFLILILLAAGIAAIFLTMQWIYSVFSFIFIESVANNDASIKKPFKKNLPLGNSYFAWNVIYLLIFFGLLAILVKLGYNSLFRLGVFVKNSNVAFGTIVFSVLPYIIIGACILSLSALLSFFISNYVLVVMYKERISILKAIPISFSLLCSDIVSFIKYIFVTIGLWIITSIMSLAISFFIILALLVHAGLTVMLMYFFYKMIPVSIHPFYIAVLMIIGIPVILILLLLINVIFVPFPVFLKTFNLKFIARVDERYNLFRL